MRPSRFQPPSDRARRAVTLVELLVVVAVGAVVLGILLGTFSHTQRLARREVIRNRQRQEALLTLSRISAVIAETVPLAALDASAEVTEAFAPDHLRVASWHGADAQHLWIHDFSEESQADPAGDVRLVHTRLGLDGAAAPEEPRRSDLWTWVGFLYATEVNPDGEALWEAGVPPGEFPALVRVTVAARDPAAEEEPFVISSTVATGREVSR